MRTLLYGIVAVLVATSAAQAQSWNDCKYEAERTADVDAAGAKLLELDAGSGSLRVEGKAGLTSVRIRGRACASDKDLLDDVKLEARRSGGSVVVKSNIRDQDYNNNWHRNEYARLDVVLEVPAGMDANIDDGSGDLELSGLGDVDLDDGSGGIIANNLGSIHIDDGSGEIDLNDIRGRVDINDGSGEITLRNIAGAIDIDDGSGEIEVRVAKSNVRISDSSGGISVDDVAGDFVVSNDGSGDIEYDNVRGRVDVPRKKRR